MFMSLYYFRLRLGFISRFSYLHAFLFNVHYLSCRSRLGLGLTGLGSEQDMGLDSNGETTANGLGLADLYYNSRPEHSSDRSAAATWSYQPPPPPVITEQPKPSSTPQHFQPYERGYPKTLESLAEKVKYMFKATNIPVLSERGLCCCYYHHHHHHHQQQQQQK